MPDATEHVRDVRRGQPIRADHFNAMARAVRGAAGGSYPGGGVGGFGVATRPAAAMAPDVWVRIVGCEIVSGVCRYYYDEVTWSAKAPAGFVVPDGWAKGGADGLWAVEVNNRAGLTIGTIVPAWRNPGHGSYADHPFLLLAFPDGPFCVKVTSDGGDGGGALETCTYTYTVKAYDDDAVTLATGQTPARARMVNVTYLAGGAGGRSDIGIAAYIDGTLTLLDVLGEVPDIGDCP